MSGSRQAPARSTIFPINVAANQWAPTSLTTFGDLIWTQPQRDVFRLNRFPDDSNQFLVQAVEVRLVAQAGGEGVERLSRVVLLSVEAPVYERLDAASQGVEQRGDRERGDHDGQLREIFVTGEGPEGVL